MYFSEPELAGRLADALLREAGRQDLALFLIEGLLLDSALGVIARIVSEEARLGLLNLLARVAVRAGDDEGASLVLDWVARFGQQHDLEFRGILLREAALEVTYAQAMTGDLVSLEKSIQSIQASTDPRPIIILT